MQALPEFDPQGRLEAPGQILEHRALLRKADGTPLALVAETYASGMLDFPLPEAARHQTIVWNRSSRSLR